MGFTREILLVHKAENPGEIEDMVDFGYPLFVEYLKSRHV